MIDAAGRVLIAQRPPGKHLAGGWEFPGGKLEPGEERLAGLARELREELGIRIEAPARPLIRVRHAYPSRDVLLDMWVVRSFAGEPQGLDGQALRWCATRTLGKRICAGGRAHRRALRLPERLSQASTPYYEIGDLHALREQGAGRGPARPRASWACFAPTRRRGWRRCAPVRTSLCYESRSQPASCPRCVGNSAPTYARCISLEEAWSWRKWD